jgi:hypothetical protein
MKIIFIIINGAILLFFNPYFISLKKVSGKDNGGFI